LRFLTGALLGDGLWAHLQPGFTKDNFAPTETGNSSSSVFNDNQTHLNIDEDKENEQVVIKASESAHPKICLHFVNDDVIPGKQPKHFCLLIV